MRLGLVTYQLAQDWDLPTIIAKCEANGFEGVELRTTHAHGVEVELSAQQRVEVRKMFEDSSVELAGLGSAFEYHAVDPEELRQNIQGTKEYTKLAADVGASGVKVRPNFLPDERPVEETIRQIGEALAEVGEFAQDYDIEIRVEVHGPRTQDPKVMRAIMDATGHANVFICWNCNPGEVQDGSIAANFELLKDWIRLVHMRDLYDAEYPWRELFTLLKAQGYEGFCLAEIPASSDPGRVMKYYRALFDCLNS